MTDVRTRAGDQTRKRLLEAAATAFSRHGYHGTSTAEIASAAGVSEPTLFKHFGSKQALLLAALKQTASDLMTMLDAPLDPAADPFEAFVERARGLLADPKLAQLSRLRNFALALTDEANLGGLGADLDRFLERIAEAVAQGQKTGAVRKDVAPADVSELVLALSLLFGFRSALEGDGPAADRLSSVVDTLLAMLRAPERS